MSRNLNGRAVVCLVLMALSTAAFLEASTWPLSAKLFPMVVSVPLFVLSAIECAFNVFGRRDEGIGNAAAPGQAPEEDEDSALVRKQAARVFAWCFGFLAMAYLLGFSIAVPLFLFLYLKPYSKEGWGLSLALTAVGGVCFYGLFVKILNVHFEEGLLQEGLKLLGLT